MFTAKSINQANVRLPPLMACASFAKKEKNAKVQPPSCLLKTEEDEKCASVSRLPKSANPRKSTRLYLIAPYIVLGFSCEAANTWMPRMRQKETQN